MKTILILLCLPLIITLLNCAKFQKSIVSEKTKTENSAIIPVPNPEVSIQDWWMPRQQAINKRLAQGNADLLFLGNSIVHGFESTGKEIWDKYYKPRNAVNMGFGWDRTQHLLWRLDNSDFKNVNPKLAIILIGTNNIGRNSKDEIVTGIHTVCNRINIKLPATKILLLGIFPRFEAKSADRDIIRKINASLSKIADQKNIFFMDIGHVFLDDNKELSTDIMADLLHPTLKGYKLFAEAIEPKVRELMGEE